MSPQRRIFTSLCLASTMALSAPAALADDETAPEPDQNPAVLAEEAAEKLILALELMLMAIPQYAMPEIMDNGDIIIRRLNPEDGEASGDPEADETEI